MALQTLATVATGEKRRNSLSLILLSPMIALFLQKNISFVVLQAWSFCKRLPRCGVRVHTS